MWRTDTLTLTPNLHISGKRNASRLIAPALAVIAKPVRHPPLPDTGRSHRCTSVRRLGSVPAASDAGRADCCRPGQKVATATNQQHPLPSPAGLGRAMAQKRGRAWGPGPGAWGECQVQGMGAWSPARPIRRGAGATTG